MAKRKPTFTKAHAAENKAMLRRAKALLVGTDPEMTANEHTVIIATLKAEFPGVTDARIRSRLSKAVRQSMARKYRTID
jgi:hypothetical protein